MGYSMGWDGMRVKDQTGFHRLCCKDSAVPLDNLIKISCLWLIC